MIQQASTPDKGNCSLFRLFCCVFSLVFLVALPDIASANADKGSLPAEVQSVVGKLIALKDPAAPVPGKAELAAFLDYTTSPVNLVGVDGKAPFPAKIDKASGILWRSRLQVPFATVLEYLFNPQVPSTVVYPSSLRYTTWQAGSDILSLKTPLWKQLGQHAESPLVLRGKEFEEITPDTNTGTYYSYLLDRVILLTEFEGKQVVISVSAQNGISEVGKKAATIGDYANWDFVYSGVKGTLGKGISWAETYIYSAYGITVFYEDAPGGSNTGYALFRWMDAGWSRMNMVKQQHITDGAERSFSGLKAFLESPKRPSVAEINTFSRELASLDIETLRQRFAPYAQKVEESATVTAPLKTDEFQNVIKGAAYGSIMTKDELVAALMVNYIKECMGKPLLAGPLNGSGISGARAGQDKAAASSSAS